MLRWIGSFTLALALHVVGIGSFFGDRPEKSPTTPPVAIMLDLIALPVEPEIVLNEAVAVTHGSSPLPAPTAAAESAPESLEPPPKCEVHAPGPGDGSASALMTVTEWKDLLRHHLDRYKQYPADAQREGQQGTPYVFFTVCRDGRVLAAHIVRTSGFESLDRAGIDLVRRAEPLPAFPQVLPGDTVSLVVPVEFFLARQAQ